MRTLIEDIDEYLEDEWDEAIGIIGQLI